MRYVAVLESPVAGLAECAQCFKSDLCRVTELNGVWVLESSAFDACSAPGRCSPLADEMLSVVRRIMSLYNGLSYPPAVKSILCLDTSGQRSSNTIRSTLTFKVTSPTAVTELTKPVDRRPLATAIYERAVRDPNVSQALKLYQDVENRWGDVYDIIEFLGGPKQIERSGWEPGKKPALSSRRQITIATSDAPSRLRCRPCLLASGGNALR